MFPSEFARTERIEQVNEQADDKKQALTIYYNTHGQPLSELLSFPIHPSMKQTTEVGREEQAQETMSDAPPPKVVPKA